MESFFSHFKKEAVYPKYPFSTIKTYKQLSNNIDYYNRQRLHQDIGMITSNLKKDCSKKVIVKRLKLKN